MEISLMLIEHPWYSILFPSVGEGKRGTSSWGGINGSQMANPLLFSLSSLPHHPIPEVRICDKWAKKRFFDDCLGLLLFGRGVLGCIKRPSLDALNIYSGITTYKTYQPIRALLFLNSCRERWENKWEECFLCLNLTIHFVKMYICTLHLYSLYIMGLWYTDTHTKKINLLEI